MRNTICTVWIATAMSIMGAVRAHADVAVIAHPSAGTEEISKSRLLDFYTGDVREWNSGEPVVVFDLKPRTDVKKTFYAFLGKTSSRMKSIWMKNMLSGEGRPPEAIESGEAMRTRVAGTPGSIGYVDAALVDDTVLVLTVIRGTGE